MLYCAESWHWERKKKNPFSTRPSESVEKGRDPGSARQGTLSIAADMDGGPLQPVLHHPMAQLYVHIQDAHKDSKAGMRHF